MFPFRWPDDFVPEEYGWVYQGAGVWLRWEIPFKFPASIARFSLDKESGAVGGLYGGPVRGVFQETAMAADVWAEVRRSDLRSEGKACGTER